MNGKREELRKIIRDKVFVLDRDEQFLDFPDPTAWLFDFRKVLMNGRVANLISDIFYESFASRYPFQLCSIEIAGVPLMTSLMTKFFHKGHEDINAFFIRKSRKKSGLFRMIEGTVEDTKKIILVDDIMNGGDSFWRQVEVLESLGYKVDTVWSILRYRDEDFYKRFHLRGIKVESLFTLDDFTEDLGERVKNLIDKRNIPKMIPFTKEWMVRMPGAGYGHVGPKSQPLIDDELVYLGMDGRMFWALNQADGSVVWSYKVGTAAGKKSIYSKPAFYKDTVVFGWECICARQKNGGCEMDII
jgi:orotate phosphoribosyltransferase